MDLWSEFAAGTKKDPAFLPVTVDETQKTQALKVWTAKQ